MKISRSNMGKPCERRTTFRPPAAGSLPPLSMVSAGMAAQLEQEERDWAALRALAEARDTGRYEIASGVDESAETVKVPCV